MSYVLVSLVGEGDAATQASDAFACWYAEKHPPAARFHGMSPPHAEIAAAVLALEQQRGFVLGHGGETLRALPGPGPLDFLQIPVVWADAAQFSEIFKGARVYVYACSTLSAGDAESFGRAAVDLGVAAYAGLFRPVHAPQVADIGLHDEQLRRAITRVVKMFLEGCDDVLVLRAGKFREGQRLFLGEQRGPVVRDEHPGHLFDALIHKLLSQIPQNFQ